LLLALELALELAADEGEHRGDRHPHHLLDLARGPARVIRRGNVPLSATVVAPVRAVVETQRPVDPERPCDDDVITVIK
jgi:hypothetical protein